MQGRLASACRAMSREVAEKEQRHIPEWPSSRVSVYSEEMYWVSNPVGVSATSATIDGDVDPEAEREVWPM